MSEPSLRDHSQLCEHGFDIYHWLADGNLCPGGRAVTIDRVRIEEILGELCRDWYWLLVSEGTPYDFGRAIDAIVTALGGER
jgi:hypothetical protein